MVIAVILAKTRLLKYDDLHIIVAQAAVDHLTQPGGEISRWEKTEKQIYEHMVSG